MAYLVISSENNMLEKTNHLSRLFDFYHPLLTDKQKEYFIMYYHEDYSLQEIANFYDVSRNAIYDQLTITANKLQDYETKLQLLEKSLKKEALINQYLKTKDESLLQELLEMDEYYV